jgi:hypothetical protein
VINSRNLICYASLRSDTKHPTSEFKTSSPQVEMVEEVRSKTSNDQFT